MNFSSLFFREPIRSDEFASICKAALAENQYDTMLNYLKRNKAQSKILLSCRFYTSWWCENNIVLHLLDKIVSANNTSDAAFDTLVILIEKYGANLALHRSEYNENLLHKAVELEHFKLCELLINRYPSLMYEKSFFKQTPVWIAHNKSATAIQSLMIDKLKKKNKLVDSSDLDGEHERFDFKQYKKQAKKKLMKNNQSFPSNFTLKTSEALSSVLYYEDHIYSSSILNGLEGARHQISLNDLFYIMALRAINHELKVFIVNNEISTIYPAYTNCYGLSSANQSIYIAEASDRKANKIVETIVHEFGHKAMLCVFENDSEPYFDNDMLTPLFIDQCLTEINHAAYRQEFDNPDFEKAMQILFSIETYDKSEHHCELAARIFQTYYQLGDDKAREFYALVSPKTILFLEGYLLPEMNRYLIENNYQERLTDVSPTVIDAKQVECFRQALENIEHENKRWMCSLL